MAGIFDARRPSGGILGTPEQSRGMSTLGILSAALADAGASLQGRQGGNLATYGAQLQADDQRRQLIAGLNSPDPSVRQQAYSLAAINGIDTRPFQQQRVAAELPQIIQKLRPAAGAKPASMDEVMAGASPEVQAIYGPKVLDEFMKGPGEAVHEGINPATGKLGQYRFGADHNPEWLAVGVQAKAPTTRNVRIGMQEVTQEFDPMTGSWKEVGRGDAFRPNDAQSGGGNVQSVQPLNDGTLLIVKRDGSTAHVTVDGAPVTGARYDPQTHFNMNAAGAAGKAAGTAAEAMPATKANFDIINQTLDSFKDPKVKAQAAHALGWQGKATFGASIPGVTSDFNARYGQLEGQAFLNAFNSLKGGGQITEIEGAKATSAIARLQKAQTTDEFYNALKDARQTFSTIYQAAQQRGSRGAVVPALRQPLPQLPAPPPPAPRKPTVSNW